MRIIASPQDLGFVNKADPFPSEVTPRLYGDQNQGALFSFYVGDIISMASSGGSPFMMWLPSRGVNHWKEPVAHLSWIAPENFDGSESYMEFLASQGEVDECDFGDGFVYQICEYMHTMDRISQSTRTEPIKAENLGMKLFERMPQQVLRGDTAGITLNNDRDWSLARLAIGMEEHQKWNVIYGDEVAIPNTYTGINSILTTGWVKTRAQGKGSCDFTDPIVINGVDLNTPEEVLRKIRVVVRRLRRRMQDRGYTPQGDDMAIMLNSTMWDYIADTIAFGVISTLNAPTGIEINVTPEGVQRERDRVRNGGVGWGFIPVDGQNIPILPESRIGATTSVDGQAAITGDIFIMTKKFRGLTILEHQYLDWSKLEKSPFQDGQGLTSGEYKPQYFQGNMVKVTTNSLTLNGLCWFYGAEMYGRIVTKMNALQARINDVTILIDEDDEHESVSFTSPNFYAFEGETGGDGDVLLVPLT